MSKQQYGQAAMDVIPAEIQQHRNKLLATAKMYGILNLRYYLNLSILAMKKDFLGPPNFKNRR